VEVYLLEFLTVALDRGEWSASCPGRFILAERAPGNLWIGDWVGPRTILDAMTKRKKSHHWPRREMNPGRPARGLVIARTELSRIQLGVMTTVKPEIQTQHSSKFREALHLI